VAWLRLPLRHDCILVLKMQGLFYVYESNALPTELTRLIQVDKTIRSAAGKRTHDVFLIEEAL